MAARIDPWGNFAQTTQVTIAFFRFFPLFSRSRPVFLFSSTQSDERFEPKEKKPPNQQQR